jgi:hypothetical protein
MSELEAIAEDHRVDVILVARPDTPDDVHLAAQAVVQSKASNRPPAFETADSYSAGGSPVLRPSEVVGGSTNEPGRYRRRPLGEAPRRRRAASIRRIDGRWFSQLGSGTLRDHGVVMDLYADPWRGVDTEVAPMRETNRGRSSSPVTAPPR